MKLIKSPIFATIVNIISLLSTLFCLIFVSLDSAIILFKGSVIIFIVLLIINIYFKNWKFILFNLFILGVSIFGIYKYLDWATLRMYQGYHAELKNGDIIFQTSTSTQSKAIQAQLIPNIPISVFYTYKRMNILFMKQVQQSK
jgi:hypothetical protein